MLKKIQMTISKANFIRITFMSKKYKNIYPNIGQILPLQSKVSMYAMSSVESLKSKTSLF